MVEFDPHSHRVWDEFDPRDCTDQGDCLRMQVTISSSNEFIYYRPVTRGWCRLPPP